MEETHKNYDPASGPVKETKAPAPKKSALQRLLDFEKDERRRAREAAKRRQQLKIETDKELADWARDICGPQITPGDLTRILTAEKIRVLDKNGQERELALIDRLRELTASPEAGAANNR